MLLAPVEAGKNTKNVVENKKCENKYCRLSKNDLFLSILSALLLILCFNLPDLSFLCWISLVPLFVCLEKKILSQRIILSFIFGYLFFLGVLYWISYVSLCGMLILCLYLSIYPIIFGIYVKNFHKNYALLLLPGLWILLELIRSRFFFSGFPWALLGHTQFQNILLIQMADKTGVLGITFLIVMVNVALSRIIIRQKLDKIAIFFSFFCLSIAYGYGFYKIKQNFPQPELSVSVIQGNIKQEYKWDPAYRNYILKTFRSLSLKANKDNPDLIVWPESSLPGNILDDYSLLQEIICFSKEIKTNLLFGSPREDKAIQRYYNSAFLFDKQGVLKTIYDKIHLVPFGEYIPYKNIFWFLSSTAIGDFSSGRQYTIFSIPGKHRKNVKFAVLICFEDIFSEMLKNFRQKGAEFMIIITNEAWFKNSTEPVQHKAISVFRAIENRCWIIRCANTGISCFISPYGRIKGQVEKHKRNTFIAGFKTMCLGS